MHIRTRGYFLLYTRVDMLLYVYKCARFDVFIHMHIHLHFIHF